MSNQASDKYIVRLPDGMRDEIKVAARAAGRSMNAEIVHRLEAYRAPGRIEIEVDTAPIVAATEACERLAKAADTAFAACERLGIRTGGAP